MPEGESADQNRIRYSNPEYDALLDELTALLPDDPRADEVRQSLIIGFFTGLVGLVVGLTVGIFSGYRGGLVDDSLRSVTDVFLVIPTIPLLVVLSSYVKFLTIPALVLILAVFAWPFPARTFRSQVLSLRKREFINLAKLSGMSDIKIVFREILPNMLPYVGTTFANAVSGAILAEVFLEILGLGPQNTTTLGVMVYWAMWRGALIRGILWWVLPPMIVLVLIFIGLQLINIGLDEVYNPRVRKGDHRHERTCAQGGGPQGVLLDRSWTDQGGGRDRPGGQEGGTVRHRGRVGLRQVDTAMSLLRLIKPPGSIENGRIVLDGADILELDDEQMRSVRWSRISLIPQGSMNSLNPVIKIGSQIADAVVAHDLSTAYQISDRIFILYEGSVPRPATPPA